MVETSPVPATKPRARRVPIWAAVAAVVFVLLAALRVSSYCPALPVPLRFELVLDRGFAGRSDPVLVAGRTDAGDFVSVRFATDDTVEFVYDSWGFPGIPSRPVPVRAGERLRLTVFMPALNEIEGSLSRPTGRVRIECNEQVILDTAAHSFLREPDRFYFGENPLGGAACGKTLHGQILTRRGVALRGPVRQLFSRTERLVDWCTRYPHQVAALLLFSAAGSFYLIGRGALLAWIAYARSAVTRHRWFAGAATVATIAYAWLVTLGTFEFGYKEIFGSFYDFQALSFLQARLDVPEDAIGGEAFEAKGKLYGYFGPTPALLRLPFVLTGFAFAKLSRSMMVAHFIGCLIAAYLILRHATILARGRPGAGEDDVPSPFSVLVLVGSVGLGSTVFFLGSRGLIFHEAILAGIAFALWSTWCSLRHLDHPAGRWWIGALACGVLSIHSRPPTGLFALTLLGGIELFNAIRYAHTNGWRVPVTLRRHASIATLCLVGLLSLNALAWLKFETFDAAPLRISRPYTYQPSRLEHIQGKSFHLANLPFNFDTYVLRPNFRLERNFPWIYLGSRTPRRSFPKARIDLPDFTLAVPYAMPSLFLLATAGCVAAAWVHARLRWPILALWLAALPMSLALFAAIATAQRYTGDFCPFLIAAAMCGLAGLEQAGLLVRRIARTLVFTATLAAMAVTVALTLHYQGEVLWGVPEPTRRNYQQLRHRVDQFFGLRATPGPLPPPRTDADF